MVYEWQSQDCKPGSWSPSQASFAITFISRAHLYERPSQIPRGLVGRVGKRPRQQEWLLGRAMVGTKYQVVGKGCYSWYGGALAPLFSAFIEPYWDKCGRKKAAHPQKRRDRFQRLTSLSVTWERLVVVSISFPSIYWFKHVDQLTVR